MTRKQDRQDEDGMKRSRRFRRVAMLIALASLAGAAPTQAAESSALSSLPLDGQTSLLVESTPELDLGDSGTIEFWVAPLWTDPDAMSPFPAVLGRRAVNEGSDPDSFAATTRYSVHIADDRQSVGLFDGTRYGSVPFDFTDGVLHHVVLATSGSSTTIYVDGAPRGTVDVGYGRARDLDLHIGSSDGESEFFGGALVSVRLWRGALSAGEIAELGRSVGAPMDSHSAADRIVAYSEFTSESQRMVVASDAGAVPAPPAPPPNVRSRAAPRPSRLKKKEDQLESKITKTTGKLTAKEQERDQIRAQLGGFLLGRPVANAANRVELGGVQLELGQVEVGGRPVGAAKARRMQNKLLRRLGTLNREIADYTQTLEGGPPAYDANGPVRIGLRQQLADVRRQRVWGLEPVNPQRGRRIRNQFYNRRPRIGQVLETDAGAAEIQDEFTAGNDGGAWLIKRSGQPHEVLKQANEPDATRITGRDPTGVDIQADDGTSLGYNQRLQRLAGATIDDIFGPGGQRGVPGLTAQQALQANLTRREVELQNLAAGTGHPAFVPAARSGQNRIRMGYAGKNLGSILGDPQVRNADPRVREAIIRKLAIDALDAVVAMEGAGVVHRDLHFGNLALDESGQLKVMDFGTAKRPQESDLSLEVNEGVGYGGLHGQMPPETLRLVQRSNQDGAADFASDSRADVWAIGSSFENLFRPGMQTPQLVNNPNSPVQAALQGLTTDTQAARPRPAAALAALRNVPVNQADENAAAEILRQVAGRQVRTALGGARPNTLAVGPNAPNPNAPPIAVNPPVQVPPGPGPVPVPPGQANPNPAGGANANQ